MEKLEKIDIQKPVSNGEAEQIKQSLDLINLANETSVLMALLCQKLGLEPQKTTHTEFVSKFSELQRNSLEAQKQMQSKYLLSGSTQLRKTRADKGKTR